MLRQESAEPTDVGDPDTELIYCIDELPRDDLMSIGAAYGVPLGILKDPGSWLN